MKCECEKCNGTGKIECDECDGAGTTEFQIETLIIKKTHPKYAAVIEFQKDAKRAISQASQLKAVNPSRAQSYDEQLAATLFVINKQAEKAMKSDS